MHCFYCNKDFIEEEWWAHPCIESKRPIKDITIDFSYETNSEDGDKTIHAYDLKGNIYRMTLPNPDKLAALKKEASDESKQEDYADWVRRRGNRTRVSVLVTPRHPRTDSVGVNSRHPCSALRKSIRQS
jgi:hypothetical protein